jgi:beta-lactamase superfamily II metal-dependent hydrolase
LYDFNITQDNKQRVLSYVKKTIGSSGVINVFINSHRDADHMRGIKDLHAAHTIKEIWDSGVPGTTTTTPEYRAYMELRRSLPTTEIDPRKFWTYGDDNQIADTVFFQLQKRISNFATIAHTIMVEI